MEYIYAALILHNAGKNVTEEAVGAILTAAGIEADENRVKSLIAALEGVDIEEAISRAAAAPAAAAPAAAAAEAAPVEEEAEEEEEPDEEGGMAGLGALFG